MNSFVCRLTGGHRYDDCNTKSTQDPLKIGEIQVYNICVKCGHKEVLTVNIDRLLPADIKRSDNNAE